MLFSPYLTQVVILLILSSVQGHTIQGRASAAQRATVCNGHADLCDRGYGTVSFVGAHDSYAIGVDNLAVNQDQNITQQLNDGIRMLQMQAHLQNGVIRLCHTSCFLFDGGSLQGYLATVKTWMDANPTEVVSLLIVNIDNVGAAQYDTAFKAVGLDSISYVPTSSPVGLSNWPTLGSMIDSGKRLVTFLDNGADPAVVPYLIDEFANIWETAFNVIDPTQFDCAVNRTKGDPSTQLYLINHFLDKIVLGQPAPDISRANVTNAATGAGSLNAHVDTCVSVNSRPPNFLLVDFYEFGGGSVFQVAASINKVTYNPTATIAQPASSKSSSSTPSTLSSNAMSMSTGRPITVSQVMVIAMAVGACFLL